MDTLCRWCERGEHGSGHWSDDDGVTEYCSGTRGDEGSECPCAARSGEAGCSQCGAPSIKAHDTECIILLKRELGFIRRVVGADDDVCVVCGSMTHCGSLGQTYDHPFTPEPTLAAVQRAMKERMTDEVLLEFGRAMIAEFSDFECESRSENKSGAKCGHSIFYHGSQGCEREWFHSRCGSEHACGCKVTRDELLTQLFQSPYVIAAIDQARGEGA